MCKKYSQGDYLVYDVYGICRISEIKKMSFSRGVPMQSYYILSPLNSPASTFYVPCDNEELCSRLRKPMSEKEIRRLLARSKDISLDWIDNRQLRGESFHRILDAGITAELIALIACLYTKKQELAQKGKKLSGTDEGFFNAAEKLVKEEFAFSLGIEKDSVTEYIRSCIRG